MSFLLMIFLTLVCLFEDYPAPIWGPTSGWSVVLAGLGVLLVAAHAYWVSRRVSWPLTRDPSLRDALMKRYERGRFVHQFLHLGVFVLTLAGLGYGYTIRQHWQSESGQGLPGLELLMLLPFFLGQLLTWIFFYDADRAAHRAAHCNLEGDSFTSTWLEARQAQTVPFDGRWTYIGFQARQKLALVFIPVVLLIVQKELTRLVPASMQQWQAAFSIAGSVGLACVFVCMPLIIRLVLGLKPMPAGPIRDRLVMASRRLRFRTSDILLWNTRNGMANAMVIGLIPWLRYVVFTDRMLDEFSDDEIEAVFGHEVGHVRHQHMVYYLGFLTLSMAVLGLLADNYVLPMFDWHGGALLAAVGESAEPSKLRGDLMVFPVVGIMIAYIFLVFGFLSRRCERQADVFGCRAVSCGDPMCRGHDETTTLVPGGEGLCVTGIQTFIRALEKVALVNGINRERPGFLQSWQHSTIARRVAFLDRAIVDRTVEPRFQIRLAWVKWGLMLGLLGALVVLIAGHGWKW